MARCNIKNPQKFRIFVSKIFLGLFREDIDLGVQDRSSTIFVCKSK